MAPWRCCASFIHRDSRTNVLSMYMGYHELGIVSILVCLCKVINECLVGGSEHVFSMGLIIPSDFHIPQRGWYTIDQICATRDMHILVGGLEHFLFSHSVGNVIIPIDSYFWNGMKPPTSIYIYISLSTIINYRLTIDYP